MKRTLLRVFAVALVLLCSYALVDFILGPVLGSPNAGMTEVLQ